METNIPGKIREKLEYLKKRGSGFTPETDEELYSYPRPPMIDANLSQKSFTDDQVRYINQALMEGADVYRKDLNPGDDGYEFKQEVKTDGELVEEATLANPGGIVKIREENDSTKIYFIRDSGESSSLMVESPIVDVTYLQLDRRLSEDEVEERLIETVSNAEQGNLDKETYQFRLCKSKEQERYHSDWVSKGKPADHKGADPYARAKVSDPEISVFEASVNDSVIQNNVPYRSFFDLLDKLSFSDETISLDMERKNNQVEEPAALEEIIKAVEGDLSQYDYSVEVSDTELGGVFRGVVEDDLGRQEAHFDAITSHENPFNLLEPDQENDMLRELDKA